MTKTHRSLLAGIGIAAMSLGATAAQAGAFGLDAFAASATGMSNAGAASGSGGIGSMYWNPATVTMAPGFNVQADANVYALSSRISPTAGTSPLLRGGDSGDLGVPALVPSAFASYQLTDRVWLGLAVTVPFGATTKPNFDWSGQVYSRTARVRSYDFNPIVGIKVTDWLSVGFGPDIQVFQVRLDRAASFLPAGPTAAVRADDVGVGFTAGVLVTPVAGTAIGVGYRSSVHHDLRGTLDTGAAAFPIKAKLNTPDQLTVGLTQALAPDLRLNLGYEWTNWSRLGTIAYVGPGGVPLTDLPLRYRDGHLFSAGIEYDATAALTVRGGLGYEISPVTNAFRTTAIPDADKVLLSAGLSYRFSERLSVDLAYQHAFVAGSRIRIGAGSPQLAVAAIPGLGPTPLDFNGSVRSSLDIVSVALRYRLD